MRTFSCLYLKIAGKESFTFGNLKALENLENFRHHIKKQKHYFADKGPSSQVKSMVFQLSCMDVRVGQ